MAKITYAGSLMKEFWLFAKANKVYWIVPLVLTMLLAAAVIVGSGNALPFIYHIF